MAASPMGGVCRRSSKRCQTGRLLFLSGMLPTEGPVVKFIGRVGAELDAEAGREATLLSALTSSLSRGSIWDRSTK